MGNGKRTGYLSYTFEECLMDLDARHCGIPVEAA
jgi:hypothetical protein